MHQHLGQLGNNKHIPNGDTATQLLCWDIWLLSIVTSHRFILSHYSYRYYILLSYSCGAMNVTCTLKYWVPEKQPTCTYLRIMGWLQFWAAFWYIYIFFACSLQILYFLKIFKDCLSAFASTLLHAFRITMIHVRHVQQINQSLQQS